MTSPLPRLALIVKRAIPSENRGDGSFAEPHAIDDRFAPSRVEAVYGNAYPGGGTRPGPRPARDVPP